jgi:RNA polymerase sigma-70 factor (ECF subfamily)
MPSDPPHGEAPQALATVTSTELLEGLARSDSEAWGRFVARYRPLLLAWCGRAGLPPEDAEDVAQAALADFAAAYRDGRYDRSHGRLRAWLHGFARTSLARWWRARGAREVPAGAATSGGVLHSLPSPDEQDAHWEAEWRAAVLGHALEAVRREVQPATWLAFERFALEERDARAVAAELGLSENAVYGAKRRVLARLREVLPLVEDRW